MNIFVIQCLLSQNKMPADTALSGNDCIDLVRERVQAVQKGSSNASMYKLIILDYSLGDSLDGPEVAQEIRKIVEETEGSVKQPYICCCSAYTESSFQVKAINAGMDNFIVKPITDHAL